MIFSSMRLSARLCDCRWFPLSFNVEDNSDSDMAPTSTSDSDVLCVERDFLAKPLSIVPDLQGHRTPHLSLPSFLPGIRGAHLSVESGRYREER